MKPMNYQRGPTLSGWASLITPRVMRPLSRGASLITPRALRPSLITPRVEKTERQKRIEKRERPERRERDKREREKREKRERQERERKEREITERQKIETGDRPLSERRALLAERPLYLSDANRNRSGKQPNNTRPKCVRQKFCPQTRGT